MPNMDLRTNWSSRVSWLIWLIFIVVSCFHHFSDVEGINVISWDVYGYYLYLPAIFKYGDIHQYLFAYEHLDAYPISAKLFQLAEVSDGVKAPIYTIGMALIYLPFYWIADICVGWTDYPADGLSLPYQLSIIFGSWVYSGLGLYFSQKTLRRLKVNEAVAASAIVGIFLGSNYFNYAALEQGMPHIFLFTLYSILIYYTILWHERPTTFKTLCIAMTISILCLARPSELIAILIPLFYQVYDFDSLRKKIALLRSHYLHIVLLSLTGLFMVSIQILYWRLGHGGYFFNGYSQHHFDFLSPHIIDGLFSYRKGWLIYSPIMVGSLLGLFLLPKRWKVGRVPIILFFAFNIYIVLSWPIWWYANCFGMRSLIQSYALLIIPLAFFLEWAYNRRFTKYIVIFIGCLLVSLNLFQNWQYKKGILLMDETTKIYYWSTFLKTKKNQNLKKYVDIKEKYVNQNARTSELQSKDFKGDSLGYKTITPQDQYGASIRLEVDSNNVANLAGRWLKASYTVMYDGPDRQTGGAKLVLTTESPTRRTKWSGLVVQRIQDKGQWQTVTYDYKIPDELTIGDQIKLLIWNYGSDTIYVKDVGLKMYENK